MTISIIVASSDNGVIGYEGSVPWEKHPADMKRFRELTVGNSVIMGRKTYLSLPESYRPLPRRQNIVMTRSGFEDDRVDIAHSLEEAISLATHDVFVAGGGEIYELALPLVERMYVTEIVDNVPYGDTFFPWRLVPKNMKKISEEHVPPVKEGSFSIVFTEYEYVHP